MTQQPRPTLDDPWRIDEPSVASAPIEAADGQQLSDDAWDLSRPVPTAADIAADIAAGEHQPDSPQPSRPGFFARLFGSARS